MTNIKNLLENNSKHFNILKEIGSLGDKKDISTFLVGVYVRDLLIVKNLTDIDIMVNKDSLKFSKDFLRNRLVDTKMIGFHHFHRVWQ